MSTAASLVPAARTDAEKALERGVAHLLSHQQPEGWWKAELETNVTMEAEDLLLRQFLGIGDARILARTAAWIRSRQRPDGGFAIHHGGDADLSATVEAYAALRLAGDPAAGSAPRS